MSNDQQKENRPDPDKLLAQLQKSTRGKLTIFLGPAAGVGKTWAMLQAAHERLEEGIDLEVGWVQLHGRRDTEDMLEDLPIIEPLHLEYHGKYYYEMNLDAILVRKPQIVVVDELAHTNIQGTRHKRRYQDVEELLAAGIDVYSTLNIQHIESLNDLVETITGIKVRETVPDYVIEQADTIRLIDIPPEELLQRLKDGKIYVAEQIQRAVDGFFRPGNINALREITMRFAARQVDVKLIDYMREKAIEGPWPASGKVMVCVSSQVHSAMLLRAGKRLADGTQAELLAVHIESGRYKKPLAEPEKLQLLKNMKLAEDLGAETLTVVAEDFVEEVLEIARSHNVATVILGKPKITFWGQVLPWMMSTTDKLLQRVSSSLNVCIINTGTVEQQSEIKIKTQPVQVRYRFRSYVYSLLMVGLATLIGRVLFNAVGFTNVAFFYMFPILLSAFCWGKKQVYLSAVLSVLAYDYFFVEPLFEFSVNDIQYLWTFLIMLLLALVIASRTESIRNEAVTARRREKEVRLMYMFSRGFTSWHSSEEVVENLVKYIGEAYSLETVALIPNADKALKVAAIFIPALGVVYKQFKMDETELAVAHWVFQNAEPAGAYTDNLPAAKYLFVPMETGKNTLGVLGINLERQLNPVESRLLSALSGMAAMALEDLTRR
ncbi:MAG: DUF4118 domain-containing protein [Negativicutes bacterium]|jgi:two-component system sensor histidine kinase KdpD